MKCSWLHLALASAYALSCRVNGESSTNYNSDYYEAYASYSAGYDYDPPTVTASYIEMYGEYFDEHWVVEDLVCTLAEDGTTLFKGTKPCNLRFSGADVLMNTINGGIDGIYEAKACENGRPLYMRQGSPPHEDRVLAYSQSYSDWDLSNGTIPNEVDVWLFGGRGAESLPPSGATWHLANYLMKDPATLEEYTASNITVTCADGAHIVVENGSVDAS